MTHVQIQVADSPGKRDAIELAAYETVLRAGLYAYEFTVSETRAAKYRVPEIGVFELDSLPDVALAFPVRADNGATQIRAGKPTIRYLGSTQFPVFAEGIVENAIINT